MKALEIIEIPKDNVNDETVIISNIHVEENQKVQADTLLIDYETSKANIAIHSSKSGYVKLLCKEDDIVNIGQFIIIIADDKNFKHEIEEKKSKDVIDQTFSKKANAKIKKLGIDKNVFGGISFVTEKVVVDFADKMDNLDNTNKIKISPRKSFEIENLTNVNRIGLVSNVEKSFNSISIDTDTVFSKNEFKGSLSIILVKVVSELLATEKYRHLNSYSDSENIYLIDEINFGLAISLGSGLKIGVIKNCNTLDIKDIENRLIDLIDKYIDDQLDVDDVTGYSVVLTDLTDQGIDSFTPLIAKNNSIMIGLSGQKRGNQNINIAFDHRVTDGLEISIFINDVIKGMQNSYPNFQEDNNCYLCLKSIEEDKKLDTPGLIKVLAHDNEEKYVCRNCLEGL